MGFNGLGIMYAKYANEGTQDTVSLEGKNGVALSASSGAVLLYSDDYANIDKLIIESRTKEAAVKISVPLARHLRILTEIYGYDAIKSLVDDMPAELRGERCER